MLKSYLKRILQIASRGDATEVSYYSAVEELLNEYAESTGKKNIHVTTLPKKTEAGNPDFRVWDGKQHITGYIEAKDPTVEDLDHVEGTEQLERYLGTFPNVILTNFFEFRLYRNGCLTEKVLIARPFIVHKLKTAPPIEKEAEFLELLDKFFSFSLPRVRDAKSLATELANRTRFLRDEVVARELREEEQAAKGILGFYEAFKEYLISGLSKEDFADLYSQTITYGLFAARMRSENSFNRKLAYDRIPHTIGILRDVFRFISIEDLPPQMEWIIDDISEVLAVTDVKKILHKYFHEGKGKEPVVHFYETFLARYDPETREKRGVYYTPEPVVSYIVRSLHGILKDHFDRPDGFASETVTVLDPAAGTLTFLAEAAKLAVDEFVSKYGDGGKPNFIRSHFFGKEAKFYAFELMMAPYAVGHLKISFLLEELGYRLRGDDRFKLYLTNTLEMVELAQTELPGMASLSEESHEAGKVKRQIPILVILGNPPYSGHSANASQKYVVEIKNGKEKRKKLKTWIGNLIEGYKFVDGKPLGEKNPKWLHDDYVKFIRFAQWKIDQAGEGILGFITNHSYLDNPTFRGMRQSLMQSFGEIRILDLHGNSLKKERCPDGSKDDNVFDIQQGVAIALFVKKRGKGRKCTVYHSERWGLRREKHDWLLKKDRYTTKWRRLSPASPHYFFVPRDEALSEVYERNRAITDIFELSSVGIVTARDKLTIRWTEGEVWSTVVNFSRMAAGLASQTFDLGEDVRDWKVQLAQDDLKESGPSRSKVAPILYRPFDVRYTYYTGKSRGFHCMPRPEVMHHMLRDNLALCVGRAGQVVGLEKPWNVVFCSCHVEDFNLFYRGGSVNFPLYLYPKAAKEDLFGHRGKAKKRAPNVRADLLAVLADAHKKEPTPEEVFFYIYAILHSNTYRAKYAEFLKIDFPKVPFTRESGLFKNMAKLGQRLVTLHLMKPVGSIRESPLQKPIARFQGQGDNRVEKPRYDEKEELVHINEDQYFEGVTNQVWEYQIGGYQVCLKWLKDRKGRSLSVDDAKHYCRTVTALQRTIEVQEEIDEIYPEVEKETIEFVKPEV